MSLSPRLNKTGYQPGELITLVVDYHAPDKPFTVTVTKTDADGTVETADVSSVVYGSATLAVADSDGRAFTKTADGGTEAVFTATA